MKRQLTPFLFSGLLFTLSCSAAQPSVPRACQPLGMNAEQLLELKTNGFKVKHAAPVSLALVDCLGVPDPNIRDGIAYEGITHWLRGTEMTDIDVRGLQDKLIAALNNPDAPGFRAPFAALVLSEVARFDRKSPFMTEAERTAFVAEAVNYVSGVTDYRGYDDNEGWRHGVAHGADWLMQLSLNPDVSDEDLLTLRDAVTSQVMPPSHAYIHGESERLARPIMFMANRGVISEEDWTDWFTELADPAPLENWGQAYKSEEGLARLHNLKAFLNVIYVNASAGSNENTKALLPGTTAALRALP